MTHIITVSVIKSDQTVSSLTLRPPPHLNWVLILFLMTRLNQSKLIYVILIMPYLTQGSRIMTDVEVPDQCLSVAGNAPKHPCLR